MPTKTPQPTRIRLLRGRGAVLRVTTVFLAAGLAAAPYALGTPSEERSSVLVDALVLDGERNPVPGPARDDFEIVIGGRAHPVMESAMVAAGGAPRRFVFVFNRRGASPAQLGRAGEARSRGARFVPLHGP